MRATTNQDFVGEHLSKFLAFAYSSECEDWRRAEVTLAVTLANGFDGAMSTISKLLRMSIDAGLSDTVSVCSNLLNPVLIRLDGYVFAQAFLKGFCSIHWGGDYRPFVRDVVTAFPNVTLSINETTIEIDADGTIKSVIQAEPG